MALLFCVYFVCVQINAIGYLAGKGNAIILGMKPPLPIDSDAAATVDIVIGLLFEAFTTLITAIAGAIALASVRSFLDARRRK